MTIQQARICQVGSIVRRKRSQHKAHVFALHDGTTVANSRSVTIKYECSAQAENPIRTVRLMDEYILV